MEKSIRFWPRKVKSYGALILILSLFGTGCFGAALRIAGMPEFDGWGGRHERYRVTMRDGVTLATDVYFPEGKGPWPVVMIRSPYNMLTSVSQMAKVFSYYGYIGIHQDVRGRLDSEGEWYILVHERNDGVDTLDWLVKQPWQDGSIGLFGASYFGFTQYAMADVLPPEVKTIMPMIISTNLRNVLSRGGMFRTDLFTGWAGLMSGQSLTLENGPGYNKAKSHFPANEVDKLYFGGEIPWYQDMIRGIDKNAPIWQQEQASIIDGMASRIKVPVMMVSGWYDLFTGDQINDFQQLNNGKENRLLIGPWTHLLGTIGDGEKDFPAAGDFIDQFPKVLNWFDHHLRGKPLDDWGPIEIYAVGDDRWESYETWPPQSSPRRLYLGNVEKSNECDGGTIGPDPPAADEKITYTYNPRDPVPTTGGHSMLMFTIPGFQGGKPSNRDQEGLCERTDVLSFTGEPLTEPLAVRGPIRFGLNISSTAPDTAFTAKLIEIDPDGLALNVRDTILRLAYREGNETPITYDPNSKIELVLESYPIAWTFKPGYRIRVDVSSSNFPAFNAHANRAGPWCDQADPVPADQTIYSGPAAPSWLELPLAESQNR